MGLETEGKAESVLLLMDYVYRMDNVGHGVLKKKVSLMTFKT